MLAGVTERREHADAQWVAPRVAARRLGVDSRTISRMGDRGQIRTMRLPSGHRRFSLADVESLAVVPEKKTA